MPPSSPPRHPREEENPEPYSLIIIVCSGKIQLQHKASCYHGHGYPNRLIFPAGVHLCYTTRTDLQASGNPVRERSTEVIRRTISYVCGALDPNPDVLLHGARLAGEVKSKKIQITLPRQIRQHHFPAQAAVLLTSEESSDDTKKQRSP